MAVTAMKSAFPSTAEPWMTLARRGQVFLLTLQRADNRFDYESTAALMSALDEVERVRREEDPESKQPWALVTTGQDKIYSNGLDPAKVFPTLEKFCRTLLHPLLRRMLTFPMPTVAALNGHAFAGGFMFAMAHDYRVMRNDRGFMCMNEIDMRLPLTPGMSAIVRAKMPNPAALHKCLLEAHRFSGLEAEKLGLVNAAVKAEEVLPRAIALAEHWAPKAQAGYVMTLMKEEVYPDIVRILDTAGLGNVAKLKM